MTEVRKKAEADYYKVLQVDQEAESEVIEAAYRALSKKYHPDINRAPEAMDRMAQINVAYTVLSDASKRRDYNYSRSSANRQNPASSTTASPSPTTARRSTDSSFTPSASASPPKTNPGATSRPNQTTGAAAGATASSFRPQDPPPAAEKPRPATPNRTGPTYYGANQRKGNKAILWLGGLIVLFILAIGTILSLETLFGNPLKTSLLTQPAVNTPATQAARSQPVATTAPATTPPAAMPANKEQITAFLGAQDLYAGRLSEVALPSADTLQLRVKLNLNGTVLNSESPATGRTADDLDGLRQSEATAYNLIYTVFARFPELSRINLVLLDTKDTPVYRADVQRKSAYTFHLWRDTTIVNDPAEASKAARQDRVVQHFGVPLSEAWRTKLNTPSEANLLAELQNIGLSAVTAANNNGVPVISYFQVRSQPETAVDFARVLYTLYTRFPTLDKLQLVLATDPNKPTKTIDRQLFNQIGRESWSQAAYGGASAGGDQQAQNLVAGLPAAPTDLKPLNQTIQAKFKTPVQIGSWAVVTENLERFENLSLENLRIPAGKDRQFLVLRVALRNGTDGRQWLMPGEKMLLVDTRGQTYLSDPAATLLYVLKTPPATDPPPGPIDPTKQGAVYVVFNVPTNLNLTTLRLQFQDGDKRGLIEVA